MWITGVAMTAAFVILRAWGVFGEPRPWITQATPLVTGLSFVNCTKQPPSLLFVLMTLGPAIAALAVIDRVGIRSPLGRALVTFGRVPLFYYLAQWYVIHGLAVLAALVRDCRSPGSSRRQLWAPSRGLGAGPAGHLRRLGPGARRPLRTVPLVRRGQGAPSRRLAVLPLIELFSPPIRKPTTSDGHAHAVDVALGRIGPTHRRARCRVESSSQITPLNGIWRRSPRCFPG
jgi:hypothetical protein